MNYGDTLPLFGLASRDQSQKIQRMNEGVERAVRQRKIDASLQDRTSEGERLRDEGIEKADIGADGWVDVVALPLIRELAGRMETFTTDEVWDLLDRRQLPYPEERRAMGPAIVKAYARGNIEPLDTWRLSKRPECHRRPLRVWRARSV